MPFEITKAVAEEIAGTDVKEVLFNGEVVGYIPIRPMGETDGRLLPPPPRRKYHNGKFIGWFADSRRAI